MSEDLNIDDTMEETLKEIRSRGETEDDNESETEALGDDSEESIVDEDAGTDESEGGTEADTDSERDAEAEVKGEAKESVQKVVKNPPLSWRPAAKEKFAKLDPLVQDEILKREEDMSKGAQMVKDKAAYGDRVSQAISPYMAMIQSRGGTVEQFIQGMGNTYYALTTGTAQERTRVIQNLARQAGVDLTQIQPPSPQEQQLSPLYQEIQQLKQQIQQQTRSSTQSEEFAIQQALTAFESETDENGLTHPYFSNVQSEMVAIIPQIRQMNPSLSHAEVLKQAYDNSIWANPETRQLLQVQQNRKADEERKRIAKERAAKAQKANKVNLSKKGEHDSKQAKTLGSIDDTIAETLKEIKTR